MCMHILWSPRSRSPLIYHMMQATRRIIALGLDMWCLCMASVFSAFERYTVDVFIRTWMFSNMASNHSWQFRRVSMCAPSYTIFSEYQQSVIIMCPFST